MRPNLRPCTCEYQRNRAWGYNLQAWVGGKKPWSLVLDGNLGDVAELARQHPVVLVRCNGCGADVLREYPQLTKEK